MYIAQIYVEDGYVYLLFPIRYLIYVISIILSFNWEIKIVFLILFYSTSFVYEWFYVSF